jgi:hypothetical protein
MSRKHKQPAAVFTTNDYFGNQVVLLRSTWDEHVLDGHPEMGGYESLVKSVVFDPEEIRLSTLSTTALAFISAPGTGPSPQGIRALVDYTNRYFEKGGGSGLISTAYPIDVERYGNPKLGRAIYSKKGGRK